MGGGAWPFLVGGVICLVNSDNERDLSLLTSCAWPLFTVGAGLVRVIYFAWSRRLLAEQFWPGQGFASVLARSTS